jgi:dienelactone hydrolase/pimeloyl-ACP methyl ester carboxylesterase
MKCTTWAVLLGLLLSLRTNTVDDLTVLKPDKDGVPPSKMLYTYLLKEAKKHFDQRRQEVALLKTPEDVKARQQWLKARFIESLGGFPEKTPLNARVVRKLVGAGFHVENVIYESRPNHHITANLYIPDGKPPFPGVLVPCGHSANGKAVEAYQRACILMAKNGLVVLCYDPIGQGERIQLLDKQGKPAIAGSTTEHTLTGIGALLVGRQTASYRIWDGIRSLDYLSGRPEIDPKRLGCTGNSGGGTLTAYLMALDDRIVAAAPSCYITSLERLFATIGPQDAEQNITGQVAFGMEHADYITMRAPKPTLICTGTRDFFDIEGAWTTFREAKLQYGLLGHGERVDLFEYNDQHGFSKPRREAAMRWMRRWLLGKDDAPVEGDFPIFKDEELQCTRTGQVLEDFKGKSVFDLNAEAEQELAKARHEYRAKHPPAEWFKEIRTILRIPDFYEDAGLRNRYAKRIDSPEIAPFERDGYRISKFAYAFPGRPLLPVLLVAPPGIPDPLHSFVFYLHGDGKSADTDPGGSIEKLVHTGKTVVALDLRGTGETSPGKAPSNKPNYLGADTREAFLSLHLDRPLLTQRLEDVAFTWMKLESESGKRMEFDLVGVGSVGPVALHMAAVFKGRVTKLTLDHSLVSWSNVVHTPLSVNQLTNVVPGALRVYDLPDLAAALAPRELIIRNPVDAAGRLLTKEEAARAYAGVRAAYDKAKAADKFQLIVEK